MSRITLTVVIRDNHGIDGESPWIAEIKETESLANVGTTPPPTAYLGFGDSPTEAAHQALDAYRGGKALREHLNREAP